MMREERIHSMERITTGLPDGVLERYHLKVGDMQREQVISAYAPSAERHAEYPADLPFIPHSVTFVTIHPNGEVPPGARWQPANAHAAEALVVAHSRANGWVDAPTEDTVVAAIRKVMPNRPDVVETYLRKGNVLRTVIKISVQGVTMLQLLDAPDPA